MQWNDSPNAGFTEASVVPWLPVSKNFEMRNVKAQEADPNSMLNLYKALVELRKSEPALGVGDYQSVEVHSPKILAYRRYIQGKGNFLIVLNFSNEPVVLELKSIAVKAKIEVSTNLQRHGEVELSDLAIKPNEGLLLRLLET